MKKNKKWFTLIEIMVTIALIWIMMIWFSNINFNNNLNKQKFEDFNNQIVTNIETVRNNALNWKWVLDWSLNLINPNEYNIELNLTTMTTWYNWTYNNLLNEVNVSFNNINSINSIKCANHQGTVTSTPNNVQINFIWKEITSSCWNNKNIIILTKAWAFTKEITFNTVTWTISKK